MTSTFAHTATFATVPSQATGTGVFSYPEPPEGSTYVVAVRQATPKRKPRRAGRR
ncbi:FtsP/CotA-like multicopper oxidase with cupredoxin domain [Crossiella equi]|uniref:FtsP/CotA-like multicopper oxidase with cupredoxin domain n=1 Tax=Crossiella equi TaxID=130796 RepID=A0ABS5ABE0_9PSEU|nr:hypothetical protein [Crossiella equi]MBP2473893.1 FtsP/CotA-like multicopper oxidase with cupredoxin domain [Crossiella equi]